MSYQRSFTKRIAVHYSGTIHYPASQNGGSVSYSGTEYEDVTVTVDVDTAPFDTSVQHCNNSVGALTGAVVATEGAQVASIQSNAQKIGQTIINGFFKTVHSEISQQITELSNRINAILLHLNGLTKRCTDKQHQMGTDYHRLSERYLKIFEELDGELKNRIYELDRPAFVFKQISDQSAYRALNSDLVGTATVAGTENSQLEARISASVTKKRALDTIDKANVFLEKQKQTNTILHRCIIDEENANVYYVPVCYMETSNDNNRIDRTMHQPAAIQHIDAQRLIEEMNDYTQETVSEEDREQIQLHFNAEISSHYAASDIHTERVKDCITRLFNIHTIKMV